jgi:hypothetical protein
MKTKIEVGLLIILVMCLLGNTYLFAKDNDKSKNSKSDIIDNNNINEYVFQHIKSKDVSLIDSAFLHGYIHNIVDENFDGEKIPTLTVQCTSGSIHNDVAALSADRPSYGIWTRDLYWGFLGWAQAGDDSVLAMMKSSIRLLIMAKNKNQALGQSKVWPLNDGRFYIPQLYDKGLKAGLYAFPWCSESQADFLLFTYNYWKLSGDRKFIESIWSEIEYVIKTLELLDTNGNSLPDALWGSYDYMFITPDTEEPLMCAKTSLAFSSVAKLARMLGNDNYADRLEKLALKIKETMNKSIQEGGLWKKEGKGGYYVNMRKCTRNDGPDCKAILDEVCTDGAWWTKNIAQVEDRFIPYDNLVPMWCGMTDSLQDKAIFEKLDANFKEIYDLIYGPMYCAPACHTGKSVMECSSVTWLAFLDVYLRGKKGHDTNRSKIYDMLMQHAHDAGGIVFPEGAGIYGTLTGGAGRLWDNGNFFHMLICGIYGLEKSKDGITISAPEKIDGVPLTELKNFHFKDAIYDFSWIGTGKHISNINVDGQSIKNETGNFMLTYNSGMHKVEIQLCE